MPDHVNATKSRLVHLAQEVIAAGFHICPEGDGRVVGPGTEGWDVCRCLEKVNAAKARKFEPRTPAR